MIASKVTNPGAYICIAMAVWGVICSCTAAAQSFSGLVAARFFLGIVEAVFFPGVIYYISLFYTRQQMALRTAVFFSGSQLGNAIGPLIAIGILELDGKQGISGWRWLFIIEGVVTIFFALIFAIILPGSLKNIRGMSEVENEALLYNYAIDIGQQDHRDEASVRKGFVLAARDPKTWLLTAILLAVSDYSLSVPLFNWSGLTCHYSHTKDVRFSSRGELFPNCGINLGILSKHYVRSHSGRLKCYSSQP